MKKTFHKILTTPEKFIKATISIENCFSITGETKYSSGCIHELIIEHFPEFQPFVDLHLSNIQGVPMHAVDNGFYWLGGAAGLNQKYGPDRSPEECFDIFCGSLRISDREGSEIMGKIVHAFIDGKAKIVTSEVVTEKCQQERNNQGFFDAKNVFKQEIENLLPRWKTEAENALKLFETF